MAVPKRHGSSSSSSNGARVSPLRVQADAHRSRVAQQLKDRDSPNAARPASEWRANRAKSLRAGREQALRAASNDRQSLKKHVSNLESLNRQFGGKPGSAMDRSLGYANRLQSSKRLNSTHKRPKAKV